MLAAQKLLRRAARRLGLDVVRSGYYSPIVHTGEVPPDLWQRRAPMPGVALDLGRQLEWLEGPLRPLIEEFDPPKGLLENPFYGPMDAHVLYAMLRQLRPARVLELGSGYSTLIIQHALAVNERAGSAPAAHQVVDPSPSPLLAQLTARPEIHAMSAADADGALFHRLEADDVLFIDTSHVVRPGGEVVRLVLETLPALAAGVVVHFHDIFRPFEYPRALYDTYDVHWQEQYLLQAFLAYNPNFEVIAANHALWRTHPDRIGRLFPTLQRWMVPSGFWLRRVER